MNKEMVNGTAIIGKLPEGNIIIETYPSGQFEICVLDEHGDGKIVGDGNWKGYDKTLTDNAWEHLINKS